MKAGPGAELLEYRKALLVDSKCMERTQQVDRVWRARAILGWVGVNGEGAGIENGPAGVLGGHKGAGVGVTVISRDDIGLAAHSTSCEGIHAETHFTKTAAVAPHNLSPQGTGVALFAKRFDA